MEKGKKGAKLPIRKNQKSLKISTQNKEAKINPIRNSSGPSPRRPAATVREHGGSGSGHAGGALNPAAESFDPEALDGQRSIISNGVNNSYRESESIYKKLVEASLQGIVIAQGIPPRLVYANPAISRILGYSPDELTSLTFKQTENLIHPDDRLTFFGRYKDRLEGKSIRPNYEIRATRKDGSTACLELSATQIEYNDEPAVLATYVDITERKHAEEALQIRGEFEKLIMTISTNFINLTFADIDEEITRTLQKIGEFAGVDRSYVFLFSEEGERMSNTHEWCAPEIKPQIQRLQRIMVDQELPYFARIIKNRKVFYVPRVADLTEVAKAEKKEFELENIQSLICVPIIHSDTLVGFLGFDSVRKEKSWSEDVIVLLKIVGEMIGNTIGRKRVEEALRESEERYRTILENIEDGYFEVDLGGNFTFFNDSLRQMLGYSKDEMIGMNNRQYTDQENAKKLFQAFNRVFRTGEPSKIFDWKIIRKDGAKRYVETSVSLITNPNGQPIGFRGIVRDITERKKSEEALTLSEERYRTLVEESFDGIFIRKGPKIVFANRRLYEMLGYEEGELEGLNHWLVYHPDYQALIRERSQARMRGESVPFSYEVKFLRKGGSSFWGEIHPKVISFLGESGIQVWARDISERKQTEETLHAERERFRSLSEDAPFGMAIIDKDGAFKYINPKFKELFGYDLNDVPDGKTWFRKAYPDPDYRHRVISVWLDDFASSKSGEKRPRVFTARCKDGSEKIINFISVQLEAGEILLACEDITERKRAEEALRESEERYRTILENIEDGYYEVDLPGNLTFFNDSLCRMLGYSRDEMIGMGNQQYTDEENRKKLFQAFKEVYKTGEPTKGFDWKVFRKDGKELFGEVSVSLVKDSKGQPIGFRGIARDITERKQAEEALRRSEEEARRLAQENSIMVEIGRIIGSSLDINEVYDQFGKEVRKIIPFDRILVNISNPEDNTFTTAYVMGIDVDGRPPGAVIQWSGSATQEVFHSKSSLLIQTEDMDKLAGRFPALLPHFQVGLRSFIAVPLISKDNVIGVLHLQSTTPNAYSEMDLRLAERVGHQIAGAIASAQLFTERKQAEEALRRSEGSSREVAKENAIMAEIGQIISSTLNIDEVYERFSEEVNKLTPFDRIAINILDPKINTATVAYVTGVDVPDARNGNVFPLSGSIIEEILRTRSSLLLQVEDMDDLQHRFPGLLTTYQAGLRSMMSVPLFSKDQIIGVLHIRSFNPNTYSERDLRLAERVGHQIAGAIANAQLFKELMQAEEDKIAIQEQLRQSQKMEAIGGLAGGIAHDFNNLLTVIKGYAELSCLGLDTSDPLRGNIEEILKASERATNLTRQLLAFSRRQILDFKVINLNTLLKDLDKMLHRILGEDIDLVYHLPEDIGKVKTDPGQIEQVILNLAVNARDAMPSGGKLTIETLNMELSEAYVQTHMEVIPGHYVMLSVSDSGAGIPPEVIERIFEPFFTTKEKGKGTGLGLSTVYGIVKQSGGNINVYSEPGLGTTFKIYLPRVEEEEDNLQRKDLDISLLTGNETILLAEDEQSVRELAARILRDKGYQVYEAPDGKEALDIAQRHPERKFHLLLTDVVMPGMSGKNLADCLKLSMPDIKVLFISGYTDNAIVHHGVLDKGVNFIQKPFSMESLARKVREVLDR